MAARARFGALHCIAFALSWRPIVNQFSMRSYYRPRFKVAGIAMRIVLVDPSRAVQRAMTRLIEEGGHEVVAFADGLEALSFITQDGNVRAMITSTQPISISGIELCARSEEHTSELQPRG